MLTHSKETAEGEISSNGISRKNVWSRKTFVFARCKHEEKEHFGDVET